MISESTTPRYGTYGLTFIAMLVLVLYLAAKKEANDLTASVSSELVVTRQDLQGEEALDKLLDETKANVPDESPNNEKKSTSNHNRYMEIWEAQKVACGNLCSTAEYSLKSYPVTVANLNEHRIRKPINCQKLYSSESEAILEAQGFEWPPPRNLPLYDVFTLGGQIPVGKRYLQSRYAGGSAMVNNWDKALIDKADREIRAGLHQGTYGANTVNGLLDILKKTNIQGQRVIVVGSEKPWVETACLVAGASHVTTLEYGKIVSSVPQIDTLTPPEFNDKFRKGELPVYDVAVSYSSIEHSGLGRYGDGINPFGDVIAVAKLSCIVKKGGLLILGLPHSWQTPPDVDKLVYNAHRIYGPKRWPLVLTNWRVINTYTVNGEHRVNVAINELLEEP